MHTKFIEATNGEYNWGKFMLGKWSGGEWAYKSSLPGQDIQSGLLWDRGWRGSHILVFDLQTGEGAVFRAGGSASADLNKHKIWVCPLFEPFLEWLYKQDLSDIRKLPDHIDLPHAPFMISGYRRPGKK